MYLCTIYIVFERCNISYISICLAGHPFPSTQKMSFYVMFCAAFRSRAFSSVFFLHPLLNIAIYTLAAAAAAVQFSNVWPHHRVQYWCVEAPCTWVDACGILCVRVCVCFVHIIYFPVIYGRRMPLTRLSRGAYGPTVLRFISFSIFFYTVDMYAAVVVLYIVQMKKRIHYPCKLVEFPNCNGSFEQNGQLFSLIWH